jgi:predicted RNA-binding protein with PIN domain
MMPLLIDGNNLLHSLPRSERSRADVRQRVLEMVRHERFQITVVFDGPPPHGSPKVEHLGRVTVRYSDSSTADDVILRVLPDGPRASEWIVVTDDRELGNRVRDRGGLVRSLGEWHGRRPRPPRQPTHDPKLSSHDIADWEGYFSGERKDDSD